MAAGVVQELIWLLLLEASPAPWVYPASQKPPLSVALAWRGGWIPIPTFPKGGAVSSSAQETEFVSIMRTRNQVGRRN